HLLWELPGGGKDQRPGELSRRVGEVTGATDHYAELTSCCDIDRRVHRTCAHEQLQAPKARQHFGWKACPLSHRDQHVEVRQLLNDLVRVRERRGEHLDVRVKRTPVSEAPGDALVVVKNANFQAK